MSAQAQVRWPEVRIGDLLTYLDERIDLDESAEYITITIRRRHGGLEERDRQLGHQIKSKKQFRLIPGAFIISRVQCWHEAYAVVPENVPKNMIASANYDQFSIATNVDRRFFWWLSHSPNFRETVRNSAFGVVIEKMVFNREAWLEKKIPVPPLAEQRRIVKRIEELAAKVQEARGLRTQTEKETQILLINQVEQVFNRLLERFPAQKFGSFSPHITSGPRNWAKHYEANGYRFYRAQDIGTDGKILEDSKVFITPPPGEQGRSAMLQQGDLMLVITGATVGRVSVFRAGLEPGFVSQHVAICRLPLNQVDAEFALWGLRGPAGQAQLIGQRYGQGKPGLNLSNIRALALPLPPLPEQRRVVAYLDGLQKQTDALKTTEAKTSVELDALMPSILDKAFRGEL